MVWLYRSPIPVGKRELFYSFKLLLPVFAPLRGGGVSTLCTVSVCVHGACHSVHSEWQWPLSGVYSIMMVKSAQPGEGGDARPSPFTLATIASKFVVYTLQLRGQIYPIFPLPFFVHCGAYCLSIPQRWYF